MSQQSEKGHSTANLHQKLQSESSTQNTVEIDPETDEPKLISHESYAELEKKLNEAEEKLGEYYDRMLRSEAEIGNVRRRAERDLESAHKYAIEKFVNELLPIIDSMERSLEVPSNEADKAVLEGVALTLKMFQTSLEKFGVEQVNPLSAPFNPAEHQAVSVQVDQTVPANTVLSVLQKGYLLNKRLIRPAFVVVSKAS